MTRITTRRPNDHDHTLPQISRCDHPRLAVFLAVIKALEIIASKHLTRIHEIKSPLAQGPGTLVRIAGDLHICSYKKLERQIFL